MKIILKCVQDLYRIGKNKHKAHKGDFTKKKIDHGGHSGIVRR